MLPLERAHSNWWAYSCQKCFGFWEWSWGGHNPTVNRVSIYSRYPTSGHLYASLGILDHGDNLGKEKGQKDRHRGCETCDSYCIFTCDTYLMWYCRNIHVWYSSHAICVIFITCIFCHMRYCNKFTCDTFHMIYLSHVISITYMWYIACDIHHKRS